MSLFVRGEEREAARKKVGAILSTLEGEIRSGASFFPARRFYERSTELRCWPVEHVALEGESPRASHIPSRPLRPAAADIRGRKSEPLPLETLESGQGRSYRVASRKRYYDE